MRKWYDLPKEELHAGGYSHTPGTRRVLHVPLIYIRLICSMCASATDDTLASNGSSESDCVRWLLQLRGTFNGNEIKASSFNYNGLIKTNRFAYGVSDLLLRLSHLNN
jgi:hypothetical protein